MKSKKNIEISGSRVKEIFILARLYWCYFQISSAKDAVIKIEEKLRFIELEKRVDNFSIAQEIILEAPEEEEKLAELAKIDSSSELQIAFTINDEIYFFSSTIKDISILNDEIPIISFNWPDKIYKEHSRQAERAKNSLPINLENNSFYIKDISTNGVSFFYNGENMPELDKNLNCVTLSIPLLKIAGEKIKSVYYKFNAGLTITREFKVGKNILFGARFDKTAIPIFLLIRQYQNIRKKEEEFFEKNQYYPKLLLPEIKIFFSKEILSCVSAYL